MLSQQHTQERVTNLREHREFEKEFEVKTALTGERNLERGADVRLVLRYSSKDCKFAVFGSSKKHKLYHKSSIWALAKPIYPAICSAYC